MLEYQIAYIATIPIYTLSVYMLFYSFLGITTINKLYITLVYFLSSLGILVAFLMDAISATYILLNIVSFLIIAVFYQGSFLRKIAMSLMIYICIFTVEIIVSVFVGFYEFSLSTESPYNSAIGIVIIRTFLLMVTSLIYRYKKSNQKNLHMPIHYNLIHFSILVGVLYLFIVSVNEQSITQIQLLIRSSVMIMVVFFINYVDGKINLFYLSHTEQKVLEAQNLSYENQNKMLTQSDANIKMLKHDMKNHLNMLNEMFKNNKRHEIEKYMKEIVDEIGKRNISESGNFAIDSILNFKLSQFEDIKLFLDVKIPQTIGISATDITIILGNLLDNAIKATLKTDEKLLKIKISCKLENLIILIDNSYHKEYQDTNYTSIENNSEHGLGLISVKNALEKYGGEIQIKQTDSLFMVSVIIPFNKQ